MYRLNLVPSLTRPDFSVRIVRRRVRREWLSVSLGCHVQGAILPAPNPNDVANMVAGAVKRVGCLLPVIKPGELRAIRNFTRRWVRRHLTPLSASDDYTVETWLKNSSYEDWRKEQLRRSWKQVDDGRGLNYRHYRCKSFIKREGYIEFKYPRTINARSDAFKCMTGPFFSKIEAVLCPRPEFVKCRDISDRPEYLAGRYPEGQAVRATDYTTFEASFSARVLYAIEMQLYTYMLQDVPGYQDLIDHIRRALCGRQFCQMAGRKYSGIKYSMEGTRMSGDMCTSLGNTFTNMILMEYACRKVGSEVLGTYEGDDGVSLIKGRKPPPETFTNLGFKLKLEDVPDVASASFCGNVFVRGENCNICDPLKTVVKFGWTMSDLRTGSVADREALLRAKAMSLIATNPGAPVVQNMALWVMRVLKDGPLLFSGVRGSASYWEMRIAARIASGKARPGTVSVRARRLCHEVFGVTPDRQLYLEEWFDKQRVLCPIPLSILGEIPADWREAWSDVVAVPSDDLESVPSFEQS